MTNMEVDDCRIYLGKFDKLGFDRGSLPKKCGHVHQVDWKDSNKVEYQPQRSVCGKALSILSRFDHAGPSFGGGNKNKSSGP